MKHNAVNQQEDMEHSRIIPGCVASLGIRLWRDSGGWMCAHKGTLAPQSLLHVSMILEQTSGSQTDSPRILASSPYSDKRRHVQLTGITAKATNLEGDVGLRADFGGGQLHVGVLAHEVDGDELLAALSREAGQAAAHGLALRHDALRAVLALVVVTRAGLQQHHGRRRLAEQPAAQPKGGQTIITLLSFVSGAAY